MGVTTDQATAQAQSRLQALLQKSLTRSERRCRELELALEIARDGLTYASRQFRVAQRWQYAERVEEFLDAARAALEKSKGGTQP